MKEVKKNHRLNLEVKKTVLCIQEITQASRQASINKLDKLDQQDKLKKELDEAKNRVEAFVYDTRADLAEDSEKRTKLIQYSTEVELKELNEAVESAAVWMEEGDIETATLGDLKAKFTELNSKKDKILRRITEAELRPQLITMMHVVTNLTRESLANATVQRDIPEEIVAKITKQCEDADKWMTQREEEQKKLPDSVDPAFSSDEIETKMEEFRRAVKSLFIYPKKKPVKPAANNATNTTNTTTTETNSTTNATSSDQQTAPEETKKSSTEEKKPEEQKKKEETKEDKKEL